jgi:cytochrome c5
MNRSASLRALAAASAAALLLVGAQCRSAAGPDARARGLAAWDTVYQVLQHPRCSNCHPAGDAPLQGDDQRVHAQGVQRGPTGEGLYAMRCANCHLQQNGAGPNLPPGAPHWQLPRPDMPLVFHGRGPADLARQLQDPARNGGRTVEQVLAHLRSDPLVLWGWDPGEGRAPVSVPHGAFVAAMESWIAAGCPVPEPR